MAEQLPIVKPIDIPLVIGMSRKEFAKLNQRAKLYYLNVVHFGKDSKQAKAYLYH